MSTSSALADMGVALASSADANYQLGRELLDENPERALSLFAQSLTSGNRSRPLFLDLSGLLIAMRKFEEAWKVCELGLGSFPNDSALLGNKGAALTKLSYFEEALQCFQKQSQTLGRSKRPWNNIATTLGCLGRLKEALEAHQEARRYGSEEHHNYASTLLLSGNLAEGFRIYEKRPSARHSSVPDLPHWDGIDVAELLIYCEQGVGDAIHACRYLSALNARGIRPLFGIPDPIRRLFGYLPGHFSVAANHEEARGASAQCAILSLPYHLGTTLETIPPPVPFRIPDELCALWTTRLGPKKAPRVAFVWAGNPEHQNDHNRSVHLRQLEPIWSQGGFQFISVQMGEPRQQIQQLNLQHRIHDLSPQISDFADTAAILSHVDLLITVDTSVAHLAGNQGIPVWTLIPFAPDWRWLLERDDSPWYPSMRLFRQLRARDWDSAIHQIAEELSRHLSTALPHTSTPPSVEPKTDLERWSNPENLLESWNARAKLAAEFVPAGATVLDLGCGAMALESFLPAGCTYMPCDLVARDERTIVCNFNAQSVPDVPEATQISMLGVLEYIHDWHGFLKQLRSKNLPLVFSYCPTDFTASLHRQNLGWVNDLSLQELCAGLAEAGFSIQGSTRVDALQILLRVTPEPKKLMSTKRVLVLSYNNVGNFGDRLGYHLVQSLIPAGAEVVHCNFRPWNVPDEHFDLLVLGIGNSLFAPILTDELLQLVRRTPRSVGIFGTQYRESLAASRLAELVDSLTVWFARHEEDTLLYGKGRSNVLHLGDWLISAFPLARWTRNETLTIGKEIWQDRPLDRTIQQIQQFRNVSSERIHPLLCALTSAEKVHYSEQREGDSAAASGKFRGMLLDIFGRSYNEGEWFEVDRSAVAGYRARVMRTMSLMPKVFEELLS